MSEAQHRRLLERFQRNDLLAEERRGRALAKLKEAYASGKINKATYEDLALRDEAITKDLIVFGRGAGVKLSERYMLGKITDDEFKTLKRELLDGPETEKVEIFEGFRSVASRVSDFVEKARSNKDSSKCGYCSKSKGFLSPLYEVSDFVLCGRCRKQYNSTRQYDGYTGDFYTVDSLEISPDIKNTLAITINSDHVLNYR